MEAFDRAIDAWSIHGATARDALAFWAQISGVEPQVFWESDREPAGLSPEAAIEVDLGVATVREALEAILESMTPGDAFEEGQARWQIDESGRLQIGTIGSLNRHPWVIIYPIDDLLTTPPRFADVPTLDLDAALSGSGSLIRDAGDGGWSADPALRTDAAGEILGLLRAMIEPAQWDTSGGSGASAYVWREALIVRAPGYIHRQIAARPAQR